MDNICSDLLTAIDTSVGDITEREFALITGILLNIARASLTVDTFNLASGLAKILSICSNDDIQRAALQALLVISKHSQFQCAQSVLDELFTIQLQTFDIVSIRLATQILANASAVEENAEILLDDAIYQIMFDWFRSVATQSDETIRDAAVVIQNIISHQRLRQRCFDIGFDAVFLEGAKLLHNTHVGYGRRLHNRMYIFWKIIGEKITKSMLNIRFGDV